MRTRIRRLKAQHNIFTIHTAFYQFIRYEPFCIVLLNPDFTVNDVKMKSGGKDETGFLPAHRKQLKVVVLGINNQFFFYTRWIGIWYRSVLTKLFCKYLLVLGYLIHLTIV